MHRVKSRPGVSQKNKCGSTHTKLKQMEFFMEDIAELSLTLGGCRPMRGAVGSLKPLQVAFVTSWLCWDKGTTQKVCSSALVWAQTASCREIPPADSPPWKSLPGFFVTLPKWTHSEFQGICIYCHAGFVSKLLNQHRVWSGVVMRHWSHSLILLAVQWLCVSQQVAV